MKRGSRIDELLTAIFMVLGIGAIVCFFALGSQNPIYLILGGTAILLRIAQYILRFL